MTEKKTFKAAIRFSFSVFKPLAFVFLCAFLIFAPSSFLMLLIVFSEASSTAEVIRVLKGSLWGVVPGVSILIVLGLGVVVYRAYLRHRSLARARFQLWLVFTVGMLLAVWFCVLFLFCNAGATDFTTAEIFLLVGKIAFGIVLVGQLGIIPWVRKTTGRLLCGPNCSAEEVSVKVW